MKKSEPETSLIFTNRLNQSTIDSSSLLELNGSLIIKGDYPKGLQQSQPLELFNIRDSLEELIQAQTAIDHIRKVQLLIEEFRRSQKEFRSQVNQYNEKMPSFEYEPMKELGDILYDYTNSFRHLKQGFYVQCNRQQTENGHLQIQLNKEMVDIRDLTEQTKVLAQRTNELQNQLGHYKGNQQKLKIIENDS